jgi:DNA processing protein
MGPATAAAVRRALEAADPAAERRAMVAAGARLIVHGDADYPPLLAVIPACPKALWIRGALPEGAAGATAAGPRGLGVAIVGSRRCTTYGREQAGRLAGLLGQSGLHIVSGGARGIDCAAHQGALRAGAPTIAVLGCGLSVRYPRGHRGLFDRMVAGGGALVSEFPMGAPPRAQNFPRRNRIISGLSVGVIVVEAERRSGALITARLAADDHGREVMAVPGRVDARMSAGCLELLRTGCAALVRDHRDVIEQLASSSLLVRGAVEAAGVESRREVPADLTERQRAIVEVVRDAGRPVEVEAIAERVEMDVGSLLAEVTVLEIRGVVRRGRGGLELG